VFYLLFTEGRKLFAPFLLPLVCISVIAPLVLVALLGRGVQRRNDGAPSAQAHHGAMLLTFILLNAGVLTIYVSLLSGAAVIRASNSVRFSGALAVLVGDKAGIHQPRLLMFGMMLIALLIGVNAVLIQGVRNGGWLREWADRLRRPTAHRGEMGSAHLCTRREYNRYRRRDGDGITLLGSFWGTRNLRLDMGWGRFCLSSEDAARGVLVLGSPGAGKTQAIILPVIADRMQEGHSLIVADPQGELTSHVMRFAPATGHLVVVHDPTSPDGPRYNLSEGLTNIPAAAAIAKVLVPPASGENKFWSDAATDLLTACLIRFDNLGEIKSALDDLDTLARKLSAPRDDASLAASAFVASVRSDGKVAANTIATLGTALTGWASAEVRKNTDVSDFGADLVVRRKTVVVLTCPGEMREVYAPYLGATLRKLMRDLDRIGERNRDPKRPGALPMPVGIILDEFPTLGRLDSLVADVNLVRKRRISILIGAQTKGQFHLIYGDEATKALFTGLATQIVYGACDPDTAEFYSKASGTATVDANPDPKRGNLRQRPLLTSDEIVNPQNGNCTIFSRFVEANYALQVILHAELTRLYERDDWRERLQATADCDPLILTRGASISMDAHPNVMALPFDDGIVPNEAELQAIFGFSETDKRIAAQMNAAVEEHPADLLSRSGVKVSSAKDIQRKFSEKSRNNVR
jgi:hypothetical protein